jgi:hypothetical protein
MPPATGRRNEVGGRSQDTGLIALVVEAIRQLLRKEKDEASPTDCFRQDSLNAFIPRFAGVWRFFYFQKSSGFALVFQLKNRPREK